jgi:osmoprotectant transport system substrate-binding protein
VYYAAIVGDEIQVVPDYTNSLLSFVLRQSDPNALPTATDVDGQIAELGTALPPELKVLTPSAAEDKDTIVCTEEIATEHSLTDLTSLFAVADQITLGAPAEFETRAPFGLAGFAEQGAEFKSFVPLAFGAIADALNAGQIDCANMFSTDPAIVSNGFVALDDDLKLVPNEAVLPLVRATVADDAAAVEALDAVSAALTTEGLTEMLQQVSGDAADPVEVAKQFLADNGLG